MQNFKAVIFDMDGLMFDTERMWLKAVKLTNKYNNYNVPIKLIKECIGLRNDVLDIKLKEYMGQGFDINNFRELNRKYMREEVEKVGLKKKKGLSTLLKFLEKNNIPMAVASSSYSQKVERKFKEANLSKHYFKHIICGEMVKNPKPDPEIYLKTCKLLNCKPNEVLALEDSENGLLSAINAGCKTVCISDVKKPSEEILNKIYKVLASLDQVITLFK